MSYSICCENSSLQTELEGLTMIDTDYTVIMNFKKQLTHMYSSYRSKKRLFSLLRFLQITGGFMITTLTTYNNPYFKDNSDSIGIIVWYISISNNIVNLLTEKCHFILETRLTRNLKQSPPSFLHTTNN